MPSIGGTELVIILVFAFLLFGPDKLPQMGRTIGRALRQFRETQQKLTNVVQTEVVDPMAAAANAPKKGSKPAAAADDDDADIESPSGAAAEPRRKETFAERRARLAAEKAQREGSSEDASAEPSTDGAVAAEAPEADGAGAPAVEAVSAEASAEPAPADEEPAEPEITTEDLYARRPRRHRAAKAAGDAPAEPASDDAAGDTSEPAADSEEGGER